MGEVDAYVAEYTHLAEIGAKAREFAATLAEEATARHAAAAEEIHEGALPQLENWDAVESFLGNEDTLALVH
jgi:hypothetical protein